ncbi:MAG: hypothetical protein AAGA93_01955 [Actinomycetota bacterium]
MVAASMVLALLAADALGFGLGADRDEPELLLRLPGGRVAGGVAVDDAVVVVVTDVDGPGEGPTTLVRLDGETGVESARVELTTWSAVDELAVVDGSLLLRVRGRLPGIDAVEQAWQPSILVGGELFLVELDGDDLRPLRQFQLPPLDGGDRSGLRHEPLVVVDGVVWTVGVGPGVGRVDLRAGTIESLTSPALDVGPGVAGTAVDTGRLVVVRRSEVWIFELESGALLRQFTVRSLPIDTVLRITSFHLHEGAVWVNQDAPGFPMRLDLDDGSLIDERPATDLPSWTFRSGGHQLDLRRDTFVYGDDLVPPPRPGDRWSQVDSSTGEYRSTFELGPWQPRFVTDDHLWVTRPADDGVGLELGRVPLDDAAGVRPAR